jgi:hypothetical protein
MGPYKVFSGRDRLIIYEGPISLFPLSLREREQGVPNTPPEGTKTMLNPENEDITKRIQIMSDYLQPNAPICGIDWKASLLEAKTELERLRKYEDTIRMACRWG